MGRYQFRACASSAESCLTAQAGGADRVELCAGISEGGMTPSYGGISTVCDMLTTTCLRVVIRSRGRGFLYSPIEVRTMLRDIEMARQLGADGVVFGRLMINGRIDLPVVQELMKVSQGLSVTFHRVFDTCRDPERVSEQIIELGCNRIFTSGQQTTTELGVPPLKTLQTQASGRIALPTGCGVNGRNIVHIASGTGTQKLYFSARESIKNDTKYKNESVSMGGTVHTDEYERNVTTVQRVINTTQAIES